MRRVKKRFIGVILDVLFVGLFLGAMLRNYSAGEMVYATIFLVASLVLIYIFIRSYSLK